MKFIFTIFRNCLLNDLLFVARIKEDVNFVEV